MRAVLTPEMLSIEPRNAPCEGHANERKSRAEQDCSWFIFGGKFLTRPTARCIFSAHRAVVRRSTGNRAPAFQYRECSATRLT